MSTGLLWPCTGLPVPVVSFLQHGEHPDPGGTRPLLSAQSYCHMVRISIHHDRPANGHQVVPCASQTLHTCDKEVTETRPALWKKRQTMNKSQDAEQVPQGTMLRVSSRRDSPRESQKRKCPGSTRQFHSLTQCLSWWDPPGTRPFTSLHTETAFRDTDLPEPPTHNNNGQHSFTGSNFLRSQKSLDHRWPPHESLPSPGSVHGATGDKGSQRGALRTCQPNQQSRGLTSRFQGHRKHKGSSSWTEHMTF
jgi:hypothetical protein